MVNGQGNSRVYREAKVSPFSGKKWRVVEVRTPDTGEIMGYELQIYSRFYADWVGAGFEPKPESIVLQYEQNTAEV